MQKPIYIKYSHIISPQNIEGFHILAPITLPSVRMHAITPDYKKHINPVQLRRLNKLQKMGIYCGMQCIAATQQPEAIIIGTSKGSMTDTEKFVKDLRHYQEEMLNPMPFIASTYNAINGSIALAAKNTGYNQTFVNRGSSFENALYDAIIQLQKSNHTHALVGGFDEVTDDYFHLKNKLNYWRKNHELFNLYPINEGTICGEVVGCFMLTNQKPLENVVQIAAVKSWYKVKADIISNNISEWIKNSKRTLIILGENGDKYDQDYYVIIKKELNKNCDFVHFKHLCGEGETTGVFALWLAQAILNQGNLPTNIWIQKNYETYDDIIIYNHFRRINHNLIHIKNGN